MCVLGTTCYTLFVWTLLATGGTSGNNLDTSAHFSSLQKCQAAQSLVQASHATVPTMTNQLHIAAVCVETD